MKQKYVHIEMRKATLQFIEYLNSVIEEYRRQGFVLSVRQLYYQCVARGKIENTLQSYKRLASTVNDGRLMGLIDWDAIEDRNRDIEIRSRWSSGSQIVRAVAQQFHMDMWENQDHRVFVIVEKAALAGVLGRICRQYDVPLLAARGYPSVSIMREMVLEQIMPALSNEQTPVILHLGDHDPSGIDMTRDLNERLQLFTENGHFIQVERIALNMDQVEELNPPPNPAKTTDSRFAEYRDRFGDESWELDALQPAYIEGLVRGRFDAHIDDDAWEQREAQIKEIKERLNRTAEEYEAEE